METASVMIQTLCVPCGCHCRYCLLSWDGKAEGAPWNRSVRTAERFMQEIKAQRPQLQCSFSFGYSMEHPDLRGALQTLRRLGSPTASFLQCDGMKMRTPKECAQLMAMLRQEGIAHLHFTLYGLEDYHDRFARRKGDYALITRMMQAAADAGIPFSAGMPVTRENIAQVDPLVDKLWSLGNEKVRLFIPHGEGRGKVLDGVRLRHEDLANVSESSRGLLNEAVYKTEADWLAQRDALRETKRHLLISLREENIGEYEKQSALEVIHTLEALDEQYYAAFPDFGTLADRYGDAHGQRLYRARDLYAHYRTLYAREHPVHVYDVTDERFSGSRRT